MTAHELGRLLLEGPDLPVVAPLELTNPNGEVSAINRIDTREYDGVLSCDCGPCFTTCERVLLYGATHD